MKRFIRKLKCRYRRRGKKGFTLIELSIVLTIIGLIIAGVLVGRDLIKGAEVQAQITQIQKYQTAVRTFQGKYGYLPGDIPSVVASPFGFSARSGLRGAGDGNGLIEGLYSSNFGGMAQKGGETTTLWVDLSTAGLINNSFTTAWASYAYPVNITPTSNPTIDMYLPKAKLGGSNYVYAWSGGWGNDGKNYFGIFNVPANGGLMNTYNAVNTGITVQQAYNIDKKIDDALPQTGGVTTMYAGQGLTWSLGIQYSNGDYDLSTGGPVSTNPYYADLHGATTSQLCYTNGDTTAAEQYNVAYPDNLNCTLSFGFQ